MRDRPSTARPRPSPGRCARRRCGRLRPCRECRSCPSSCSSCLFSPWRRKSSSIPRMTSVLQPHAPVAERALLPGDPGRALRLAQQLLDGPKMVNHHRGLWGYSGEAADGGLMTIQSTGLGGPSAAAVVADLIALGARPLVALGPRRVVRAGTADAPRDGAAPGELVVAEAVLPGDGASRALGAEDPLAADATLAGALRAAAGPGVRAGLIASTDLLPEQDPARQWTGVEAVDLTSAAVLAAAARGGAAAACIVGITGVLGDGAGLESDALEVLEQELGWIAAAVLAAGQ